MVRIDGDSSNEDINVSQTNSETKIEHIDRLINDNHSSASERTTKLELSQKGLRKTRLQKATDYINQHLSETITQSDIAIYLGISQCHFGRLFKQSMEMTVHAYLIQQRVKKAQRLLQETELSILVIAEQCGFANPSHLAKNFRKHTGMTPRQFRKSL
jgi:AraC family transcriptional regulator